MALPWAINNLPRAGLEPAPRAGPASAHESNALNELASQLRILAPVALIWLMRYAQEFWLNKLPQPTSLGQATWLLLMALAVFATALLTFIFTGGHKRAAWWVLTYGAAYGLYWGMVYFGPSL